jgi:hypothetical protein
MTLRLFRLKTSTSWVSSLSVSLINDPARYSLVGRVGATKKEACLLQFNEGRRLRLATRATHCASSPRRCFLAETLLCNGECCLPQAGKLVQDLLLSRLSAHGYHHTAHSPCLFKHVTRDIYFTLVADDFLVKYKTIADANHLISIHKADYRITEAWSSSQYLGMSIFTIKLLVQFRLACPHTSRRP